MTIKFRRVLGFLSFGMAYNYRDKDLFFDFGGWTMILSFAEMRLIPKEKWGQLLKNFGAPTYPGQAVYIDPNDPTGNTVKPL